MARDSERSDWPAPALVVFDVDGTLVDRSRRISPRVRAAVARAMARGVKVALCTGRPLPSCRPFARELELTGPQICCDGALVKDFETGEVVLRRQVDVEAMGRVLAFARRAGICCELYLEDAYYVERDWAETAVHGELIGVWSEIGDLDAILASGGVIKGQLVPSSPEQVARAKAFYPEVADRLRFSWAKPPPGFGPIDFVNVVPPEVSKGEALRALAGHYGVPIERTLAVGDGLNDLPLILAAGLGVAMGNAPEEVRRQAGAVTASVEEDGLALAIERYVFTGWTG